jgi:hypothetical protein
MKKGFSSLGAYQCMSHAIGLPLVYNTVPLKKKLNALKKPLSTASMSHQRKKKIQKEIEGQIGFARPSVTALL